ncbi:MAG: ParB/RepB/Spo0J family partition protein [Alphaproteobacteria bacterium]
MSDEVEVFEVGEGLPNPKARGLGRGLNALFDDEEDFVAEDGVVLESGQSVSGKTVLGVEEIYPGQAQPRHVFDEEPLEQLAQSIREHGVLQPLVVRLAGDEAGRYEIIAGERRWRAAQLAQLHEVPVVIVEMDDTQALEVALIENLQREDLNPIDEAMGYQRLMDEYGHTQEKLAKNVGKSRSHIANMVRLLNLPPLVHEMLKQGELSMGHARALITAKNAEALAVRVFEEGLSVRETERLANEANDTPKKKVKSSAKTGKDADTLALENDVSNSIGMKVSIDSKNGKAGRVTIDFKNLDQLDALLQRLAADNAGARLAS